MHKNENKYDYIKENLEHILTNVEKAKAERKRADKNEKIEILAVTKNVLADKINYALLKGITVIGENKTQELLEKYSALNRENAGIHFIGQLQTNKVKYIADKVSMIHSLDSVRLAEEINRQSEKAGKIMNTLVQVNIGREESKGGVEPDKIIDFLEKIRSLQSIKVKGLMVIPPLAREKGENVKYFKEIYNIFIDIKHKNIDNVDMEILSAGMSDDYEDAIREGANLIRIGKMLFGDRP